MLPGYNGAEDSLAEAERAEELQGAGDVLLPHDFINFHLTGIVGGVWRRFRHRAARRAGKEMVRAADRFHRQRSDDALPPLASSRRAFGLLRENLRQAWGLSKAR